MDNTNKLPRSTPEEQGISSSAVLNFLEAVEKNKLVLNSFMFLRHGFVISEGWWSPYSAELKHTLFSLSKSFTSTAVGIAVEEGLLSVEDGVISFFPEELPDEISENLSAMKVKHLLSMSTGHSQDTLRRIVAQKYGNWVKGFFHMKVDYKPGTHFCYNTGASYMLSAIIQKITGQTLLEYLKPRLFQPLGIENAVWEKCPRGINIGGFGLSIKTEDIAKFGQLYLQKGSYNGKHILSENWVEEATSSHISNGADANSDWAQGYCYQFWRCRHNAYRGDGSFGQYCVIMPEKDAVIAITSGLEDMQFVLNLVWEHLLPAMSVDSLKADETQLIALRNKLNNLKLFPEANSLPSVLEKGLVKSYKMDKNELNINTISIAFDENHCILKISDIRGEHEINCGIGDWMTGKTNILGMPIFMDYYTLKTCARGVWKSKDVFVITLIFVETPFTCTLTFRYEGIHLYTDIRISPAGGLKQLTPLKGESLFH